MNKAGQMSAKSRLLTLAGERFPGGRGGDDVSVPAGGGGRCLVRARLALAWLTSSSAHFM